MPNNKTVQKEKAKYLYFTTSRIQKDIAKAIGVSAKAVQVWAKKGNWAELKKAAFHSPDQETQHLYEELREINDNIKKRKPGERYGTKEELEAKAKIIALIMGPLKNASDWRNITPDIVMEEPLAPGAKPIPPEKIEFIIGGKPLEL